MKQVVTIFLILSIFVAIAYFYSERRYVAGYNAGFHSVIQDSSITHTDTVFTTDTVKVRYDVVREAEIDTINDALRYTTQIDTSVYENGTKVATLKQDISLTRGIFSILTDIDVFPVERLVTTTETVYQTATVEVPASPPFYNTFWFGSASTIIAILLIVLLL